MYKKRCYVSAAYLDGSIYACGGLDGHVRLKCAEKYEISQNAWTPIPDMIQSRSDASCTSYNGKIPLPRDLLRILPIFRQNFHVWRLQWSNMSWQR